MLVRLALDLIAIALTAWFWSHCARPVLLRNDAGTRAYRLVLGVTILTLATYLGEALANIADVGFYLGSPTWWAGLVVGILWIAVVGFGFLNGYRILTRLLAGR